MKKYLFIFIFAIFSTKTMAQTNIYHPFPDSNAVWGIRAFCMDAGLCGDLTYIKYYYGGDTLINGSNYKIILQQGLMMTSGNCCGVPTGAGAGYLRQDTVAKKVYWRDQSMSNDTLLYDFSVNVGDTLKGLVAFCQTLTVHSIDSILIGTTYRKRINYDVPPFAPCPYSIIEGIGGTSGLTYYYYGPAEMGSELTCFSENGNLLYLNSCNPDTIPCGDLTVGVNEFPQNAQSLVFPNPFHSVINLQSQQKNLPLKLFFYDVLGKIHLETEITTELSTIDLSFLSKGVYFIKIENESRKIEFKKIVKYD
jgi:hypothetical protein